MAEDDGFLTSSFASPKISVPYALVSAFLAGATPGTARAAQGLNAGLGIGLNAEKHQTDENKRKRLSESLNKLSQTTVPVTSTKIGMDPETTTYSKPSGERLSDVMPDPLAPPRPLPTFKSTEQKPVMTPVMQEYIRAVGAENPTAAATVLGRHLIKEDKPPVAVRPGGALIDPRSGQVVYQAPAAPAREVTPPAPRFATQGGEAVDSVFDPVSKQWVTQRRPVTAAPARQLSPEQAALIQAQTGLVPARAAHLRAQTAQAAANAARMAETVKQLKDPNITKEKLTTMRAGLLREKDMLEKGPEHDAPENLQRLADINLLLDDSRQRLAALIKKDNPAGGPGQTADPKDPLGIRKGKGGSKGGASDY